MRVLFLSNFYPPHHRGGYEEVCAEVAQRLCARGHDVVVLTSNLGAAPGREEQTPAVWRLLRPEVDPRRFRGTLSFFFARRRRLRRNLRVLAESLRAARPDAVVVWGMWNLPRHLLVELEKPGAPPVLYYVHDYWPLLPSAYELHWREPAAAWYGRAAKRLLAVVALRLLRNDPAPPPLRFENLLCVSEAVRERLREGGVPTQGARVLPAGIDTSLFRGSAARPGRPRAGDFTIGYVGRLKAEKGVETALDALAELTRRGHAARLAVVGRGPGEKRLRQRVRELGLEARVEFRGFVDRGSVAELLRGFDAVVVPSLWPEPWARVIQEAMAVGAAVVASRVGGTPSLIADGESGLLYEAGDARGLADRMERLIRDPPLRVRLGERAARVAGERFDVAATVDRIEQLLAALARQASGGQGK